MIKLIFIRHLYPLLFFSFLFTTLNGQSIPDLFDEFPPVLSPLQYQLAADESDLVLASYDDLLKKEADAIIKGIAYFQKGLLIKKERADLEGLVSGYRSPGNVYQEQGNYKKALQQQMEAFYISKTKKMQTPVLELLLKNNQLLLLAGGLGLVALLATFLFFIFRKHQQLNTQKILLLQKEQETHRLNALIEAVEKERKRIARELHDELGTILATVKMEISSIPYQLPQAKSLPNYQKAESLLDNACRTVRELSHDLMPYVLEQQGLEFAISDMCHNLSNHYDISFDFNYFGEEQLLSDILKTTTFRISQELLKNIIQHAEAHEVIVQLTIEENELTLIVEDDGKGFDVSTPPQGMGIDNIRSRVAYLNGTLEIDSIIGQGSTFTIQLPLNKV